MCIPIHQRSRRERILFAIANLSLAAGIALPYVFHSANSLGENWLHAARGFLMGIAIGVHLFLGLARRRKHYPAQ